MRRSIIIIIIAMCTVFGTFADSIGDGWWAQTASTAGEGNEVGMEIKSMTPHTITLDSSNGWLGYAWYDEEKDLYTGFFELILPVTELNVNSWAGDIFHFTLCYDGLTLTMEAASDMDEFKATFWLKEMCKTE